MRPFALLAIGVAVLGVGCSRSPTAPDAAAHTAVGPAPVTVADAARLGYRVVVKGEQKLYCREERLTGSHVRGKMSCLTAAELAELQEATRQSLEEVRRSTPPPQGRQ